MACQRNGFFCWKVLVFFVVFRMVYSAFSVAILTEDLNILSDR